MFILFCIVYLQVCDAHHIYKLLFISQNFTHDQQFGFKSKQSTDFCIEYFHSEENVKILYTTSQSCLHLFLDTSKAFDKINHI